jgi:hypothetical protein
MQFLIGDEFNINASIGVILLKKRGREATNH